MPTKTLFGLTVIPAAIFGGIVLACLSKKIRDLFFILLVVLCPLIERLDVNFVSREWYRGTSRGFEVSVLDVLSLSLLASSLLFPKRGHRRFYWPASLGLMLLLFFYSCYNVAISEPNLFGQFELLKVVHGLVIFLAVAFYLQGEREMRLLIFALGTMIATQAAWAFKQRYVDGIHRVFASVDDSNSLSVLFCTVAPFLAAAFNARIPKLLKVLTLGALVLTCLAEVLTISRAGIVIIASVTAAAALATISWRITVKKIAITMVVLIAAGGITGKAWNTLKARFSESNLKQEYANKKNLGRGYYLRIAAAMVEDRWLGVGLNNWSYWASIRYGPRLGYNFVPYRDTDTEPRYDLPPDSNLDEPQAAPAHSLGALTMGELGIPGFVLLTLLWLRWFQMGASFLWKKDPDPMRRMGVGIFFALWGMFLQSLTEWVFRHYPLYYVVHILLGALASLYYLKRKADKAAKAERELAREEAFAMDELRPAEFPGEPLRFPPTPEPVT